MIPIRRVCFRDKDVTKENTRVADLDVRALQDLANGVFKVERASGDEGNVDRHVAHLSNNQVATVLAGIGEGSICLRVKGDPSGFGPEEHRVLGSKVLLAVRSWAALMNREVWLAFLRCSTADAGAIAAGRLSDVSDAARPILKLFVERQDAVSALRVLCSAFSEAHSHATPGQSEIWFKRAKEVSEPRWWRNALDGAEVRLGAEAVSWRSVIGSVIEKEKAQASATLLRRLALEAGSCPTKGGAIERLIEALVSADGSLDGKLVAAASEELRDLVE